MKDPILGGCLCGGTRYELLEPPQRIDNCHCIDCRRAAAAAFVTWGGVLRHHLRLLSGTPRRVTHANRIRHFAVCCGTPLFFEASETAEWIDVTICSLDLPGSYEPGFSIWTEDRLPWIPIDQQKPAHLQSSPPTA